MSDIRTLELIDRSGGVLLAVPGMRGVIAWRAVGLPAIPIGALAEAPPVTIQRFWSALERVPLPPSQERTRREAARNQLAKHIRAGEGVRSDLELQLARVNRRLVRDIIVCAPTVAPSMAPDASAVGLLRRLQRFQEATTLRVAQWRPKPIFRKEFLETFQQNAFDQATEILHNSFREDLSFLSIDDDAPSQPALGELACRADATPSGQARFIRGVDREIANPLLQLEPAAPPMLGAIRLAEATIVRQLGALHAATNHAVSRDLPAATAMVNGVVRLSDALVKLVHTELKLLD